MKKTDLRKYARLIARVGANVQKGQPVAITATLDQPEFVTILVEECYKAGASSVEVRWHHPPVTRLGNKNKSVRELQKIDEVAALRAKLDAENKVCKISLRSVDPNAKTSYPERAAIHAKAQAPAMKGTAMKGKIQQCLCAVPNENWAKQVFPNDRTSVAVEKLWKAILTATRCDCDDPIAAWNEHNANLRKRSDYVNALNLKSVRYYASNGTDITMETIPGAIVLGGAKTTSLDGYNYNANIPTEECFAIGCKNAKGIVYGTMPWCYQGKIIEDYWLKFEGGRVVDFGARTNKETLENMLNTDEGARALGEFALVPWESPINQNGVLFYDTLFDENACCHLALGNSFPGYFPGGSQYTKDDFKAMGMNYSRIHQDFMIGTADLCIDGMQEDGTIVPIFKNGTWAF